MWMLTLPNLIGYAVIGWLLFCALSHLFAARELQQALRDGSQLCNRRIAGQLHKGKALSEKQFFDLRARHPSATVAVRVMAEPELARDDLALQTWIARSTADHLGEFRLRVERIHAAAPAIGLLGTIVGFLIATWTFAQTQDQSRLLTSVALALVTTLAAGIVALIERWILDGLYALEEHLSLHGQEVAVRIRAARSAAEPDIHGPSPPSTGFRTGGSNSGRRRGTSTIPLRDE